MTGNNSITVEYGRKLEFTAAEAGEWLDDLEQAVDDMMHMPLGGQECPSGGRMAFAPFAFCAPEVIRGAVTHCALRSVIADRDMGVSPNAPRELPEREQP